tara:strand:+ start:489 stop:923 length:435 start_codon:yes stop_codon:yes gene_type:complete
MSSKVNLDVSEKLNITCKRGDTFNLGLLMKDSSGDPINVSDYVFLMQVKGDPDPVTGERPLIIGTSSGGALARDQKDDTPINFDITTDASGNVTIKALAGVMAKVSPGSYVYDIQQSVRTATGDVVTTIFEGRFIVNDDISNYE